MFLSIFIVHLPPFSLFCTKNKVINKLISIQNSEKGGRWLNKTPDFYNKSSHLSLYLSNPPQNTACGITQV